jgi:hypothetical protein
MVVEKRKQIATNVVRYLLQAMGLKLFTAPSPSLGYPVRILKRS